MRVWALVIKELRLLTRDVHAAGALFVMPSVFLIIMALAMSGIMKNSPPQINLSVQAEITDSASDFFAQALQAQLPDSTLNKTQDAVAVIQLPTPFSERLLETPHQGPSIAFSSSSDNLSRQHVRSAVTIALAQTRLWAFLVDTEALNEHLALSEQLAQVQAQTQSQLHELQILANGTVEVQPNASQLSIPAWLIFGMFFIVLPMSNSLQVEFNSGTLLRLKAVKLPTSVFLLSKLIPYALVNLLQFVVLFALGYFVLPWLGLPAVRLTGNILDYALLALCISTACCCFGLLISALAKNTEQALLISAGSNLILAAIGGIMVPKSMMPSSMQQLAELSPMSWALDALLCLLVGQGHLNDIAHWCAYLLIFALCSGTAGVLLLHKRVQNTSWTSLN